MGDMYTNPPQSRNEAILRATIDGTEYTDPPQSRIEDLLLELKEAIEEGGGSVESYEQLTNKPQINGTTLSGDKSTEDLIPIDKGLEFDSDGKLAVSLGNGLAFNSDGEIDNLTEANPSDSATGELSKLKVGSVIYSVVTKAVNDLTNYYTKSEVYTKTEVNNIAQARFAVVAQLPTEDIQTNVIYLVPKSTAQTNNDYDEYIYTLKSTNPDTYGWEKIGDTEIDLSDYVTTQALNTALADYTTTTDLTTLLAGKQNTLTFDATPTAQSTNPVTSDGIKSYVDGQGAKTVSGNPITITDAEGMNADHVVATITPTQTGSGTPSPSNVRPFVGTSFVNFNVYESQVLLDYKTPIENNTKSYEYKNGSMYVLANGQWQNVEFLGEFIGNAKRRFSCELVVPQGNNKTLIAITSVDGGTTYYNSGDLSSGTHSIDVNFDAQQGEFLLYIFASRSLATYNTIQVNNPIVSNTMQGQTYTVQLGDTYYQANIDVTSGKLTCDHILEEYDGSNDEDWAGSDNSFGIDMTGDIWLSQTPSSNMFVGKQPQSGNTLNAGEFALFTHLQALNFKFTNDVSIADVSALRTWLASNPIQVLREITPIEIQLTPQQIALLENNNTITTNVSSLDITYQTNNGIGDTASALDKRVTRLESKVPQPPTTDGTYNLTVTVASGEPTYSWESAT